MLLRWPALFLVQRAQDLPRARHWVLWHLCPLDAQVLCVCVCVFACVCVCVFVCVVVYICIHV